MVNVPKSLHFIQFNCLQMIIFCNQIICDAAVQKIDIKIENNLSQACFSNQGGSYPRPFKMHGFFF